MRGRALVALVGLTLATGCATHMGFACEADAQCVHDGVAGTCEVDVGVCSFPDDGCTSGRRYGALGGGSVAGMCVPDSGASGGSTSEGADPTSSTSTSTSTSSTASTTDGPDSASTDPPDSDTADASTSVVVDTTGPGPEPMTLSFGEGSADIDRVTRDTHVTDASHEENNGSHRDIHIFMEPRQVGLLAFDVAVIPEGSTILDVELDLHTGSSPSMVGCQIELHLVEESWDEGTGDHSPGIANWSLRAPDVQWSADGVGGGTFDPVSVGAFAGSPGDTPFAVTLDPSSVQRWVDDPSANHGLRLSTQSEGCAGWVMSSEADEPDQRPMLTVQFVPPE
jgi:hypothetical protein